jgi:hypothetical protein
MQISKEEKLAQLERILRSRSLQGADNLRGFLRFVVDRAVGEGDNQIKEYVIATEVFGRGAEFDSRIDSVVRVQAGRLRAKLHDYYSDEGRDDPILIDLPKGQYTPVFSLIQKSADESRAREYSREENGVTSSSVFLPETGDVASTAQASAPTGSAASVAATGQALRRFSELLLWRTLAVVFGLSTIILGALAYNLRGQYLQLSGSSPFGGASGVETINRVDIEPLWGDFLNSSEPVLVVYSNTLFSGSAEDGMKLLKSLDSPGSSVGSPILPQHGIESGKLPVIEHYTGVGEVMGAFALGDFLARAGHPSRVKRSLLLTWEDMKTENIVVLGSPAENFFLRDLPQQQEMVFKSMPDEKGGKSFGIVNTRPKPGEPERYFAIQGGPSRSQILEDYAVVSLLRGLTEKKHLLILAGITTLGTQAAAEYATKPDHIENLIEHLNIAPQGDAPKLPENFQILLRVKVNGGVPVQVSYVTHNVLNR